MDEKDQNELDLGAGIKGRDKALDQLENTTEGRRKWVARGRFLALWIVKQKGRVSSDDVRILWPVPPDWDPRIMGAVFNPHWCKSAGLVPLEHKPTRFKQAHARPQQKWALRP